MADTMKCPKCGGEMEEGIVVIDAPGRLVKTFWGTNPSGNLLWKVLYNKHIVKTNRCKSCGFLESYAK